MKNLCYLLIAQGGSITDYRLSETRSISTDEMYTCVECADGHFGLGLT